MCNDVTLDFENTNEHFKPQDVGLEEKITTISKGLVTLMRLKNILGVCKLYFAELHCF